MKNKILIELIVPEVDEVFNIYIPINKRIGNIIGLVTKSVREVTNGIYEGSTKAALYNKMTGEKYSVNQLVRETNIRNASVLVLI